MSSAVQHLPALCSQSLLTPLREAAEACFRQIPSEPLVRYGFTPYSYSVRLTALLDFGALRLDDPRHYRPNNWHQDGGLGVSFPPTPGAMPPMSRLVTCWIPLSDCGRSSPGIEFINEALDRLLHYTELDDARLRQCFPADAFWAPDIALGDALVFPPGTLHRTYVRPEMTDDRLSIDYRFFPPVS
jgi:hypothetical protein